MQCKTHPTSSHRFIFCKIAEDHWYLTPPQVAILWISVVMSINAGLWLQQPTAIVLGVAVTCMSVIEYYLLPDYFWLWSAMFAGLPLVYLGTYLLIRK